MTSEQIAKIESILQYTFADKQLLITAFTHSSYANLERDKNHNAIDNYERMAFVGDSILKMVVAEYLYGVFPDKGKGEMSRMRSNLESRGWLSPIVDNLGLTKHLRSVTNLDYSDHLCADLYEAVVCAIYLDGGYSSAKQFILNTLSATLDNIKKVKQKDSKTLLQEYCQDRKIPAPKYVEVRDERAGTDNNPVFKVDLYIGDEYMCSGKGKRIKLAEQDAASKYLKTIS